MLAFTSISQYKPGDIYNLISNSYAELVSKYAESWSGEREKWKQSDTSAFNNPIIGKCMFITTVGGVPIGLASWDPRAWPEKGVIGQNCILPSYRGHGYGIRQLEEILRIFKENNLS